MPKNAAMTSPPRCLSIAGFSRTFSGVFFESFDALFRRLHALSCNCRNSGSSRETTDREKASEAEASEPRASDSEAAEPRRERADLEREPAAESRGDSGDAAAASVLALAQAEAAESALQLAETRHALAASEAALDAARADAARARALGGGDGGDAERVHLENADSCAELDAMDPAFLDEAMAMKRAHDAQTETVERYKAKLRRYAARLGERFEPEPKKR